VPRAARQANLARYIADEAQHKRQETLDVSAWPLLAPSDIPEQKNGCDCGVFMLKYADWLVRAPRQAATCCAACLAQQRRLLYRARQARKADFSFTQRDMAYFRKRIVAEVRRTPQPSVGLWHVLNFLRSRQVRQKLAA
jgi:sentrin-specific protease 1